MDLIFLNDCAADGCKRKNLKGKQLCKQHQDAYDRGERVKAFYGKTLLKKDSK